MNIGIIVNAILALLLCLQPVYAEGIAKPLSAESTEELSAKVASQIANAQVAEVQAVFSELLSKDVRTEINSSAAVAVLSRLFFGAGIKYQSALDAWVKEHPDDFIIQVIRSWFYYRYALQVLEQKYELTTSTKAQELYEERLAEARQSVNTVLAQRPIDVLALYVKLRMAPELNLSPLDIDTLFTKIVKRDPYLFDAYLAVLIALTPSKGESEWELLKFARKHAESPEPHAPFPYLLPFAHGLLSELYGGKDRYFMNPKVWGEIRNSYDALLVRYPKNPYFFARYAEDSFYANQRVAAARLLQRARELAPKHELVERLIVKHPELVPVT